MAKKEETKVVVEDNVTKVGEGVENTEKELVIPPNAIVDVAVTVISQDADIYHKTGDEFQMGKKRAEELQEKGWVKIKTEEKK